MAGDAGHEEGVVAHAPALLLYQREPLRLRRRHRHVKRSRRGKVWVDEVALAFGGGDGTLPFFSRVLFFDVVGR